MRQPNIKYFDVGLSVIVSEIGVLQINAEA